MSTNKNSTETMDKIFSYSKEPVLFKNILCTAEGLNCWKLLDWSLLDFANKCEDLKLPFRVGKNSKTFQPQWEVNTPIEEMTMKIFLNKVKQNCEPSEWYYFDYKHLNEWFKDKPEILNSFDWQKFNLDKNALDSTMWIGSKGAHTICHQDTYGCNLVAQSHGRKLWLLFPPECSDLLKATRVPYEESTIYSKYNFFTPSDEEINTIIKMSGKAKMIVLEPKDVLYIPKGWWHYVECLETSLSVNIWLSLDEDCEDRLKESIVNLIVSTIGYELPKAEDYIQSDVTDCIELVKKSLEECQKVQNDEPPTKRTKLMSINTMDIYERIFSFTNHMQFLPSLTSENIEDFRNKNNIKKIEETNTNDNKSKDYAPSKVLKAVVESICDPSIVSKIAINLQNKFVNNKT